MTALPVTHIVYETRQPVTALTMPHRYNEGTRLVLDECGRVFRHDDRDLLPATLRSRR